MAAEAAAQRLLTTLQHNPCLEERCSEESDEVPAKLLVDYFMERRRKQKILCGQLKVLSFLLEFLQQADTASWEEETAPEILSLKAEEAKCSWKLLKDEYQDKVQEIEDILPQLLKKLQCLQERKQHLEECLQRYQSQKAVAEPLLENKAKQELQRLQGVVQSQHVMVEKCQAHIHHLKGELLQLEQSVSSWIQTVSRDSELHALLQKLQGISLVSVGDTELVLDLDAGERKEIPPLRMSLLWTPHGNLHIESDGTVPAIPQELQDGSVLDVRPVFLELQNWYRCQAQLLRELKGLQERFAVDWHPEEQTLRFLTGSSQYTLLIGKGYPHSGVIQLVSLKGLTPGTDPSTCKPPVERPSLTDWLEYLHSLPHIGNPHPDM